MPIERNEGVLDRIIRTVIGLILFVFAVYFLAGFWKWLVLILGVLVLISAMTGFCVLYKLFGFSSVKQN